MITDPLTTVFDDFIAQYKVLLEKYPAETAVVFDSAWPSECYTKDGVNGEAIGWLPVIRKSGANFSGVEQALDISIHPDIVTFYTRYWSDNLNAVAEQGGVQLLQPWNEEDFDRLQENIIGHLMMKRRLEQPETLFFALTDEDDFILSVDNASGEVMLEQIGLLPERKVADNLASFIAQLKPTRSLSPSS